MPNPEKTIHIRNILNFANSVSEMDVNHILRKDLSELSFQEAEATFNAYRNAGRELVGAEEQLYDVPLTRLQNLSGTLGGLWGAVNAVLGFDSTAGNVAETRRNLLTQVENAWTNFYDNAFPVWSFLALKPISTRNEIAEATRKEVQADREAIQKMRTAAESDLAKIKTDAAEAGVSQEAIHFKTEAEKHRWSANCWLLLSVVLTSAILLIAGYHFFHPMQFDPASKWIVLQRIFAKLIFLSVLWFLVLFSARNFAVARHNNIVNRQRANALATFQTFVAGTADQKTKDSILLYAARAAFTPQKSGFIRKDDEPQGTQALEIVRALVGGK